MAYFNKIRSSNNAVLKRDGSLATQDAAKIPTMLALSIKPPKADQPPTLPFTQAEFEKVLKACGLYPHKLNRVRLRALTLLLRLFRAADNGCCDFVETAN